MDKMLAPKMPAPHKDTRLKNEKALQNAAVFLLITGTAASIILGFYLYSVLRWIGIVAALLHEAVIYAFSYLITVVSEISVTLKNRPQNKD